MNAKDFEKYAGKRTKGEKGKDCLSGGKIIGYDPKDFHPLQLLAIDDIHGDGGKMFEVIIPDKMDLKDWSCGKHKYIWVTVENVIMDESKEITEQNKKTVMETRNVKITLETAKRWYEQGGEFKEMALSAFTEAELNQIRNEWEKKVNGTVITGHYITSSGEMFGCKITCSNTDKSTFKTEKQAKSALAYAQLTQLMALPEYNGDWVPDWSNIYNRKYVLCCCDEKIVVYSTVSLHYHISFKTAEIRDKFLENNLDLLKEYFELD